VHCQEHCRAVAAEGAGIARTHDCSEEAVAHFAHSAPRRQIAWQAESGSDGSRTMNCRRQRIGALCASYLVGHASTKERKAGYGHSAVVCQVPGDTGRDESIDRSV
jgi:hypothetical protein